ncbi:MAG: DUF5591 domain-containing protein [Thermoplasmatota archaeon]
MLEILSRDGLARRALWRVGDRCIQTPGALFLASRGIEPFRRGEAFLSTVGPVNGKPTLVAGGSWFLGTGDGLPEGFAAAGAEGRLPVRREGREGAPAPEALSPSPRERTTAQPTAGAFDFAEALLLGSAALAASEPGVFARELVGVKSSVGYGRVIYAPGLGAPQHIALFTYCGVDLFDSSPLLASARRGLRLFAGWRAEARERGVCHCPACERLEREGSTPGTGQGPPAPQQARVPEEQRALIYEHNCYEALSELGAVRAAIDRGQLRELVESRLAEPWMVSLLRILDLRHGGFCERYFPVTRPSSSGVRALTEASLTRPELARFRERVIERYMRPPSSPILLLLPCSARKPYSTSVSHRALRAAVEACGNPGAVHSVVMTSPLGVVPLELECHYPASSYDVPVTGDWSATEARMIGEQLRRFVAAGGYRAVVCHITGMGFLPEYLPPSTIFTAGERAISAASLSRLSSALGELVAGEEPVSRRRAESERAAALCRFQWGKGGEGLAEGCDVRRRGPALRILSHDGTQLGYLGPERGLVSLTMAGGARLLGRTAYEVEIGDFRPTSAVFAPGVVRAGDVIRPGDEVLVTRSGELVGVGVALMSGPEMEERGRGIAVKLRHHMLSGARTAGEGGG